MYKFEKKIRSCKLYEGIIVDVLMDDIELPNKKSAKREIVVHPGGVCILPVDNDGKVYLVEQYRYAAESLMLEAPAGKLEPGEDPLLCAKRELIEETGCSAGNWISLGDVFTSPGFSTEKLHLYLATDLKNGTPCPDEDEFVELKTMRLDELIKLIDENKISDGKTVIAALRTKRYFEKQS